MSIYRHDFTFRPMSEARRQHIHGPIEAYRAEFGTRALNRQLVGVPLVMMLVGVVVLGFAVIL